MSRVMGVAAKTTELIQESKIRNYRTGSSSFTLIVNLLCTKDHGYNSNKTDAESQYIYDWSKHRVLLSTHPVLVSKTKPHRSDF